MAPSIGLVGRADALAAIQAAVDGAAGGRRGVVLVVGEPGIGKTTLLRGALAAARTATVWATGDEAEAELDHGVVEQLVRGAGLPGELRARLLPEVGADPLRVGAMLVAGIDGLDIRPDRPLVVVIDDAQWADLSSLQALAFAARRLPVDPVVLCLATRPDGLDRLPAALHRLVADEGVRIDLEPLDEAEVQELANAAVDGQVDRPMARRLLEHTGGNPLHLRALLEELDPADLASQRPLPLPRSFSKLVLARLAGATPEVEALVLAVAVLGDAAPITIATEVAALADPGAAIDDAVALGFLVVGTDGAARSTLSMVHPLMRAAVVQDVPLGRRSEVHRRAGAVVPGVAGLRHRLAGTLVPDQRLFEEATEAATTESLTGAHSTAASLLRGAADLAPSAASRSEALLEAVAQLLLAGRLADAASLRPDVEGIPPSPARDFVAARLAYTLGPRREARPLLERAWQGLRAAADEHGSLGAQVAAMLATTSVDRGDGADALRWGRLALAADPAGAALASAAHMLAGACALTGAFEDCLVELDHRCERLAADESAPVVLDTRSGRGLLRLWTHDLAGAAEDLSAALDASARAGSFVARESVRAYLAEVRYRQGWWDDAIHLAELTCSIVDDADQRWMAALPHATAARLQAARGGPAAQHLAAASAAAALAGGGVGAGLVRVAELEVAVCTRSTELGLAAGRLLDGLPGSVDDRIASWRANFVELLLEAGELDTAERVARDLAAAPASALVRADSARADALLADRRGDPAALEAVDPEAVTAVDDAGPYPRARLELVVGSAWRRRGERRRAMALLLAAEARFRDLGAVPWAERTATEIRAGGLRPRRGPGVGSQLTPQEQTVARLVAEGRTNREVAAELVVSAKTVEHHLSRIYAKVGVRSRTELARNLHEA